MELLVSGLYASPNLGTAYPAGPRLPPEPGKYFLQISWGTTNFLVCGGFAGFFAFAEVLATP